MVNKERTRFFTSIIINIILVILAVPGAAISFGNNGFAGSVIYYTQDSNIFLGAAALLYSIAAVCAFRRGVFEVPLWVRITKYFSVCCISVTFIVVIFILLPMVIPYGGAGWILFGDSQVFQHTLSPIIAIAGFIFFEKKPKLKFRMTFFALIPTFIYAAVLYPLNIAGIVDGPYPFLQVHNMSPVMAVIWFLIILAVSYLTAWLVWWGNRSGVSRDPE